MILPRARIIPIDELGEVERWNPPSVDSAGSPPQGLEVEAHLPTTQEIEAIHRQAYEEGYTLGQQEGSAAGYAEGMAAARAQLQADLDSIHQVLRLLGAPLEQLDEEMEHSIVDLAILIARQIVRRELRTSPGEVVAVVREAISQLPVGSRDPCVRLNPDDLELVRGALALHEEHAVWRLEADPLIQRGGCLVETATSYIDATVEARLAALVAKMLGGEREGDRDA